MMRSLFSLFDQKAKAFMTPFAMPTKGMAIRCVMDAAMDGESMIGRHPEDFCLYQIGEFDDALGVYHNLPQHENLGLVSALLPEQKPLPLMAGIRGPVNAAEVPNG